MNMIVAVDKDWAIGNQGRLLVTIPHDQKLFREETTGKVVVMGHKTLESLPSGIPLAKRTNVVLTKNEKCTIKDTIVCHSFEETLELLKRYPSEDIFIIGGESIYTQFLPFCDTIHVTYIDYKYEADTHFPNLDQNPDWVIAEVSDENTYFNLIYEFRKYVKRTEK